MSDDEKEALEYYDKHYRGTANDTGDARGWYAQGFCDARATIANDKPSHKNWAEGKKYVDDFHRPFTQPVQQQALGEQNTPREGYPEGTKVEVLSSGGASPPLGSQSFQRQALGNIDGLAVEFLEKCRRAAPSQLTRKERQAVGIIQSLLTALRALSKPAVQRDEQFEIAIANFADKTGIDPNNQFNLQCSIRLHDFREGWQARASAGKDDVTEAAWEVIRHAKSPDNREALQHALLQLETALTKYGETP